MPLCRALGALGQLGRALKCLGDVDRVRDVEGARARYGEALAICRELDSPAGVAECLAALESLG